MENFGAEIMISVWGAIFLIIGYLFIRQSSHDTKIKLAETNISSARNDLDKLAETIDEGFEKMAEKMDKIEQRIDLFVSNEIRELKEIAKK